MDILYSKSYVDKGMAFVTAYMDGDDEYDIIWLPVIGISMRSSIPIEALNVIFHHSYCRLYTNTCNMIFNRNPKEHFMSTLVN